MIQTKIPLKNGKCHCIIPYYDNHFNDRLLGRVVIPKPLRNALHLSAGDSLELNSSGDEITLRPVHEKAHMQKNVESGYSARGSRSRDFSIPDFIDQQP